MGVADWNHVAVAIVVAWLACVDAIEHGTEFTSDEGGPP